MRASLILVAAATFATAFASVALANETAPSADSRLMIVDGNHGQVIYDDGRDDLFCVTRVHRWSDEYGYRHRRRTMHCR